MENLSEWWSAVLITAVALTTAAGFIVVRRRSRQEPARGGEIADLNRLLQEGSITPEEYDLLKRRLLAGQVA